MMKKLYILLFFLTAALAYPQQKYALVIGNANYTEFGTLKNPVNDANDMADALQKMGFTVDKVIDGNLRQMESAVVTLRNRLSAATGTTYGFFYYAGHGVQMDGMNYLIPVDAVIPDRNFLRERTISMQVILDMLNDANNTLNMIVLDACRDFPASWSRSVSRGLATVNPPADSIIMYATGAGKTANDGTGRNGLFTGFLLQHLAEQGIEVNEIFRRTGADVRRASNNDQNPALYTDFYGTAYLGSPPAETSPVMSAQVSETLPNIITEHVYSNDLVKINGGVFVMGSPSNEQERYDDEGPQHNVTISSFNISKYEITVGQFRQFATASGYKTEAEINGGGFEWNGSDWQRNPARTWKTPGYTQGDNHPVVFISWNDAIQFCNWLSKQENLTPAYTINGSNVTWNRNTSGYRLPTEAEWEYSCRAGTLTRFWSGNDELSMAGKANIADLSVKDLYPDWDVVNIRDGFVETSPIGSFSANPWGLYDMHGNVWEWCWDWYGNYITDAQIDPTGPSSGTNRVYRGGSWGDNAQAVRSAYRGNYNPSFQSFDLGFRVVRP
ncbi:MAG: SUMF1/EgtB/PvdO family nonheme iron enzyme [Treponema sp.]|nr:SUMF1/EgtB/PvdO family nonheme iron enzyme [Treponema sp.]